MNWLNLEIRELNAEFFQGAGTTERGVWISLLRYCAEQENGGQIPGATSWIPDKWIRVMGIRHEEVVAPSSLWAWEGQDLVVRSYPVSQELAVQAKRTAGKLYGRGHPKIEKEQPEAPKGVEKPKAPKAPKIEEAEVPNGSAYPEDFVTFWDKYPLKVGKADALKAWKQTRKRRPALEVLLKSLDRQCRHPRWKAYDGKYIPYPASWLRAGRWDDELPPTESEKQKKIEAARKKEEEDFQSDQEPEDPEAVEKAKALIHKLASKFNANPEAQKNPPRPIDQPGRVPV